MCKNIVRNVIEYAQIHQILTDNKCILHQRFSPIYVVYLLYLFARPVFDHTKATEEHFSSMALCATIDAHLMQQLFDSACHVYNKCVSTYKTCLGNNMCEFSCCNCSPFLFFSVSTKTSFFSLPVSPITLKSTICFNN